MEELDDELRFRTSFQLILFVRAQFEVPRFYLNKIANTLNKMKGKKLTAGEKGMLVNEQRFSMIVVLCNILDSEQGVSNSVKSAVAASLLNMIEMSFIPSDDDVFADLINHSIDNFCRNVEDETGIEDYRDKLLEGVSLAKDVINKINEKARRIKEADEILKGICLN